MLIDCWQNMRQTIRSVHNGVATLAKQIGEVILRFAINGDSEYAEAHFAGFQNSVPRILYTIAAFIVVQIVGFAVAEQ